jgi:cellulose synthase/poly-beta-1,6-N-acetylglucosamine synthase-like glycosyltransferase
VTEQPLISVIITSYTMDRLKDVCELLDAISHQTYPRTETIFVAERSREMERRVRVHALQNGMANLKVVFNEGEPGLSAARNLGIRYAGGTILAFIDDDALPSPGWAGEIARTFTDESIAGVTGPALSLWEGRPAGWFPDEFDWLFGCSAWCDFREMRDVRNVWGMNMAFRKEALDVSGPFLTHLGAIGGGGGLGNQKFASEEVELSLRVKRKTGKRIVYNPAVKVRHKVYSYRLDTAFIARRAYSEGFTKAMLNRMYRDKARNDKPLNTEYRLLKRILFGLLPDILKTFFTRPGTAWRRFSVSFTALSFVAIGYCCYLFPSLLGLRDTLVDQKGG